MTRDPCGKTLGLVPRNRSVLSDFAADSLTLTSIIPGCLGGILLTERHNSFKKEPLCSFSSDKLSASGKVSRRTEEKKAKSNAVKKTTTCGPLFIRKILYF